MSRPAAADAQRLRVALDAGEMGTRRWDLRDGKVEWDTRLEALFGLEPGSFDGSFDTYQSLLHPDDRQRLTAEIEEGMRTGAAWGFDHRAVWPDGSLHWLEGRGEPVRDESGAIVGATGVTINIDARFEAAAERSKLLTGEREAREFAEQLSGALQRLAELSMALSGAATFDEVARAMVHHGMHALDAQFGWFGLVDPASEQLVTRAQEGYPDALIPPYGTIPRDQPLPANDALRTGTPLFIETPADRIARYPDYPDAVAHDAFVVVPLATSDNARGVLSFGYANPRPFTSQDRRYIAAVVEACVQALRRAGLFESEQATRSRLRTLLDYSEQMTRIDDPEEVLDATARFAARRIGRFASVYAVEPDGSVRRATMAHANPAMESLMFDIAARGVDGSAAVEKVARSGEPIVVSGFDNAAFPADIDEEVVELLTALRPVSLVVVPMTVPGRTRGVILVGDDRPAPAGTVDLELVFDVGRRGASAFERAQLWRASQEQLAIEHRNVEVLQRSIVPEELPDIEGCELTAVYRPADATLDVGGDWYDAFELPDGPLVVVVGDVAGHGIDAAALMGRARNALRAYAVENPDPAALLGRVHRLLLTLDADSMVTVVVGCYYAPTRELRWSRAGHPPPLVSDAKGARFLEDVNGVPLGTVAHEYETASLVLDPGALLVLYTDGLIERRDTVIDEGLDWLASRAATLHDLPVADVCRTLANESFAPIPSDDDLCVLVLRVAR
ncbi:MAG: SpoIIE family protein phosphatase [Actinomycetota bacterium]